MCRMLPAGGIGGVPPYKIPQDWGIQGVDRRFPKLLKPSIDILAMPNPEDGYLTGFGVNVIQNPVIPAIHPESILFAFQGYRIAGTGIFFQGQDSAEKLTPDLLRDAGNFLLGPAFNL